MMRLTMILVLALSTCSRPGKKAVDPTSCPQGTLDSLTVTLPDGWTRSVTSNGQYLQLRNWTDGAGFMSSISVQCLLLSGSTPEQILDAHIDSGLDGRKGATAYTRLKRTGVGKTDHCILHGTIEGGVQYGHEYVSIPEGVDADWRHTPEVDGSFTIHYCLLAACEDHVLVASFEEIADLDPKYAGASWKVIDSMTGKNLCP